MPSDDKVRWATYREALFLALGEKCAKCGETDRRVLTVDHIKGGGSKERRMRGTGFVYLRHLLRQVRKGTLRLLCANCQHRARLKLQAPKKGTRHGPQTTL